MDWRFEPAEAVAAVCDMELEFLSGCSTPSRPSRPPMWNREFCGPSNSERKKSSVRARAKETAETLNNAAFSVRFFRLDRRDASAHLDHGVVAGARWRDPAWAVAGKMNILPHWSMLGAPVFQIATNLFNDAKDFERGGTAGPDRAAPRRSERPDRGRAIKRAATAIFALAALAGLYWSPSRLAHPAARVVVHRIGLGYTGGRCRFPTRVR